MLLNAFCLDINSNRRACQPDSTQVAVRVFGQLHARTPTLRYTDTPTRPPGQDQEREDVEGYLSDVA
jgi:hypothetical protein